MSLISGEMFDIFFFFFFVAQNIPIRCSRGVVDECDCYLRGFPPAKTKNLINKLALIALFRDTLGAASAARRQLTFYYLF